MVLAVAVAWDSVTGRVRRDDAALLHQDSRMLAQGHAILLPALEANSWPPKPAVRFSAGAGGYQIGSCSTKFHIAITTRYTGIFKNVCTQLQGVKVKQKMRALHQKLDLATYSRDKVIRFKLSTHPDPDDQGISVPVPIMYRFYHLGRAYDLHQLKNFIPTGITAVDFISMRLLVAEIEALQEVIGDPVLKHYGNQLVDYISGATEDTKSRLIVSG